MVPGIPLLFSILILYYFTMRVVFMGRKPDSIKALDFLIEQGFEIACVVAIPKNEVVIWKRRLWDYAESKNIPVTDNNGIYRMINQGRLKDIDLVISYLYPYKVKKSLLSLPKIGAINFHPSPLPELKGLGGYNVAILEDFSYYGVSAHFMSEEIDSGDIIKVRRFPIDAKKETTLSLEKKTRPYLLNLFYEVMLDIKRHKELKAMPQKGGRYINREEFERMKVIKPDDTKEVIDRKIRAFFYPPYEGAIIKIDGKKYTLITKELMEEIGKRFHDD